MLASLTGAVLNLTRLDLKARFHAMGVTAVLTFIGVTLLLTGMGFGLALLYVWLKQLLATVTALAVVASGCVLLALILIAFAALPPKSRARMAYRAPTPPPSAAADHIIDKGLFSLNHGSRKQLVTRLSLVLVVGFILGRRI